MKLYTSIWYRELNFIIFKADWFGMLWATVNWFLLNITSDNDAMTLNEASEGHLIFPVSHRSACGYVRGVH